MSLDLDDGSDVIIRIQAVVLNPLAGARTEESSGAAPRPLTRSLGPRLPRPPSWRRERPARTSGRLQLPRPLAAVHPERGTRSARILAGSRHFTRPWLRVSWSRACSTVENDSNDHIVRFGDGDRSESKHSDCKKPALQHECIPFRIDAPKERGSIHSIVFQIVINCKNKTSKGPKARRAYAMIRSATLVYLWPDNE